MKWSIILETIAEWSAVALSVSGVYLTSVNDYPLNLYVSAVGSVLWVVVGLRWRKGSLLTISVMFLSLYAYGIVKYMEGF